MSPDSWAQWGHAGGRFGAEASPDHPVSSRLCGPVEGASSQWPNHRLRRRTGVAVGKTVPSCRRLHHFFEATAYRAPTAIELEDGRSTGPLRMTYPGNSTDGRISWRITYRRGAQPQGQSWGSCVAFGAGLPTSLMRQMGQDLSTNRRVELFHLLVENCVVCADDDAQVNLPRPAH